MVQCCERNRESVREMKFFILEKGKRQSGRIGKNSRVFVSFCFI